MTAHLAPRTSNPDWTIEAAVAAFDGEGPRGEIVRALDTIGRRDLFLNVGFSRQWQPHWRARAQTRLVDRLARKMRRYSKLEPTLLDVGCGRGGPALRLHEKWHMDVTGIDLSERNIEIARQRARDLAIHEGLLFRKADARHMPFSAASFSFATVIELPSYIDDKRRIFEEIARVLKRDGVLAMAVLLVDEAALTTSVDNLEIYLDFLRAWGFHSLGSAETYTALLAESGFKLKKSELQGDRTLDPYRKRLRRIVRLLDNRILFRISTWLVNRKSEEEIDLEPVRNQLESTLRALEAGILDYGLFWAKRL